MAPNVATSRRTILNPMIWGPALWAGLRLLVTREVPWYCKVLVVAAVAYAISPIDILPDVLPVIGWTDDVAVVLGLLSLALSLIPAGVLKDNPMEKAAKPVTPSGTGAGTTTGGDSGRGNVMVVRDVSAVEVVTEETPTRGR